MKPTDNTPMPRKNLHLFYILDTSKSMAQNGKIETLNAAMKETLEVLKTEAKKNADAKLHVVVLEFNSGANWITQNGAEALEEDFIWTPLQTGGLTDLGAALNELNAKLSKKVWLDSMTGALMPILIFMTDGQPTDNYKKALEQIRKNNWFLKSTKIGFAIGDNADEEVIAEVVGNSEAVIRTTDLDEFRKLLVFVSVRTSLLVSESQIGEELDLKKVIDQGRKELDLDPIPDIAPEEESGKKDDTWNSDFG